MRKVKVLVHRILVAWRMKRFLFAMCRKETLMCAMTSVSMLREQKNISATMMRTHVEHAANSKSIVSHLISESAVTVAATKGNVPTRNVVA
jgi:hypothetical protein